MNCIGVLRKVTLVREGQPTGGALVRLLLEVDCAVMSLQAGLLGERLATVKTGMVLLSKVHHTVMTKHVVLPGEHFATGCI